jgi:cellobiose-specific phosphotransferase system component IIA
MEIEKQCRLEVLRAVREAKEEAREAQAEMRKAREETREAHQTIAELQRELSQWKDQARNWQQHFLRVEQDRCAQSSRIDELLKSQVSLYSFILSSSMYSDYYDI